MTKSKKARRSGDALVAAILEGKDLGELGDEGVAAIAASAAAKQLTGLSLRFGGVGPAGAKALAGSPNLTGLSSLDLEGNEIGDSGAEALAGSRAFPKLRSLKLGHSGLGERGQAARNGITARGALSIVLSAAMSRLEELGLPLYQIDAELAGALVESPLARFLWIGPGAIESSRASPDGKWTAAVTGTSEVWPDGPRAGTLEVGAIRLPDCGPSIVWSGDSRTLAASRWLKSGGAYSGKSELLLLQPPATRTKVLPGEYGALALWAADGKRVRAFDVDEPSKQLPGSKRPSTPSSTRRRGTANA